VKLLLDTHVALALIEPGIAAKHAALRKRLLSLEAESYLSVASLWEIVIKLQIGKLTLGCELAAFPELMRDIGVAILPIDASHVLAIVAPAPATRDPFDRLLLGVCAAEGLQLVTGDRALAAHPLGTDLM
jgi:PIN domain nuclease of toxin-antitoxin system